MYLVCWEHYGCVYRADTLAAALDRAREELAYLDSKGSQIRVFVRHPDGTATVLAPE